MHRLRTRKSTLCLYYLFCIFHHMSTSLSTLLPCQLKRGAEAVSFEKTDLPTHGGVYALCGAGDELIQLAGAENLRRVVAARLTNPSDEEHKTRPDVLSVTYSIRWVPTYSQFETSLRFHEVARVLYPATYRKLCAFGPCYFAVIDLQERFPRWQLSTDPFAGRSACVGPFARKNQCEQVVAWLEDLFSLCRYHHILEQTPNGLACAYFEMGRCPAPCDGTLPFEQYREMLESSVGFVGDRGSTFTKHSAQAMRDASTERAFEQASRHKQDLELAERLRRQLDKAFTCCADLRYLGIQRAGGRSKVKAFFFDRGHIEISEPVHLKKLDTAVSDWVMRMHESKVPADADRQLARERVWLVSHFVSKGERAGGLWIHQSRVGDSAQLASQIADRFAVQRKSAPPADK